jgi:carbamoyl-phosphate synthase large subunit
MVNYFKDALAGIGKVHAANSTETYAMKKADKSVISPLIYDDNYIDFILEYCHKYNIKAVISLFDIDLPILAKNKEKFAEQGIKIVVSNLKFIEICNDKWLTYNFLRENGFNTPRTFLEIDEVFDLINRNSIVFPLIIKPRWGMGSIGIFQADNIEELKVLYKKTSNSINESYLKFESQKAPAHSVIIQEKLLGDEYGMDIFNDLKGNFLSIVSKKKLAMRAGETDSAIIIENENLNCIGEKISTLSKHIGNLDVDVFSYNNNFYILEMNCRFGGQYPFSHLAGVNFPKALIKMLLNEKLDKTILNAKIGTVSIKDIVPVKLLNK